MTGASGRSDRQRLRMRPLRRTDLERPLGEGVEDILTATGIQQALDPVLGLIGPLGELFTG